MDIIKIFYFQIIMVMSCTCVVESDSPLEAPVIEEMSPIRETAGSNVLNLNNDEEKKRKACISLLQQMEGVDSPTEEQIASFDQKMRYLYEIGLEFDKLGDDKKSLKDRLHNMKAYIEAYFPYCNERQATLYINFIINNLMHEKFHKKLHKIDEQKS